MRCFSVHKNEIEGRFDPFYYKPEIIKLVKGIKGSKFDSFKFREIIQDISGGATPKIEGDFYSDSGIPFLRVQNITEEGINLEDVKFIKNEVHEKMLKRSQLHENELIFTITGRIGSVAVVPKNFEGNINQHSVRIKLKEYLNNIQILPEYIALFFNLKIGQILSFRETTGGTRPALDYEAIKSLVIPLPDALKQRELADLIKEAYIHKKSKQAKAKQLLNSINDYILDELGIKVPESKDRMTYAVNFKEMENRRLDPFYHRIKFEGTEKAIYQGNFEVKKLKDSFKGKLIKGLLPSGEEKDGHTKVLQIKNILKNGLIDISEYVTSKNIFKPEHRIKKEEIIIVITGATIGKVGLWGFDEEFYLGGDMVKFSVNNRFNAYFIQAFLISQVGQYQLIREITGATNKHLAPDNIKTIKIPLPPITIQNRIAKEVKTRTEQAKTLQEEAKEELKNAKEKVEKILLENKL